MIFVWICLIGTVLGFIYIYNRFVQLKQHINEATAGIEVQLKRRHDLIPNIVEAVKGYAKHEKDIFDDVTRLRSEASSVNNLQEASAKEKSLATSIKGLFIVAENYPELKADQNFRELQQSLTNVEDCLQLARRYYNGTVRNYNILVDSFPSNLIAHHKNYQKEKYFEIVYATERKAPDVEF